MFYYLSLNWISANKECTIITDISTIAPEISDILDQCLSMDNSIADGALGHVSKILK